MKTILIISATSRNNLILAKSINTICCSLNVNTDLINLEEYNIPLYTPIEQKKSIPLAMQLIMEKFIKVEGFIICAPEYNGSIPPILTNVIAWLSVMGEDWRLVFNGKVGLIATHSGGEGNNLLQSLRIQLNHLGTLILPRAIMVNNRVKFDINSATKPIKQLIKLL
tara:strand:- start:1363 stop:1863 length:501 start_codon:yes stop_codon:yes gene_type:complete